jgi:flagellar basal-body rod modification protein FlgD
MAVDPTAAVSSSKSSNTSTLSAKTSTLNYDSFLKLLIAQMQNQDPTKPMDSTEFVAQLASFSNVEQGMQTNSKLDSLMTSMALIQADGLIGRTVTSSDGKTSGEVASVRIISGGAVAVLTNGKEVPLDAGITVSQHEPS